MLWYVKAMKIPSHIERECHSLRNHLTHSRDFIPCPHIPMVVIQFSSAPLFPHKRETCYLSDTLGEGGLIMDRLVEEEGLLYWGSSRMAEIKLLTLDSPENTPFAPARGILLGRIEPEDKRIGPAITLTPVNWKKARIIYAEIDFAPQRLPGQRENWPQAVRWRECT